VIDDLDQTLKELLIQKVPIDVDAIDVKFEMPTSDWASTLLKPTINVFLYDVRENLELRSSQRELIRAQAMGTGTETPPPARIDLTYLISVWTNDMSDEHQLLGRLLAALLRHPYLPQDVLKGVMQDQPLPLHAWIAQPERTPNPWDFWGSLDGRLKAGISYVVTAAIELHPPEEVRLVTERVFDIRLGVGN
jgi:hypothetical protein